MSFSLPIRIETEQLADALAVQVEKALAKRAAAARPKLALSMAEAAEALSISPSLLSRMTKDGDLPFVRFGSRRVIPIFALAQWVRVHTEISDEQGRAAIAHDARKAQEWLAAVCVNDESLMDPGDLRAIVDAKEQLREAVDSALRKGRSWSAISRSLDVRVDAALELFLPR